MAEETKSAAIFKMLDELNKEAFRKIDEEFFRDDFEEKVLLESASENDLNVEVKERG